MDDIERIIELAGLNELKKDIEFVNLERAVGDALTYIQTNQFDTPEEAIEYTAGEHKVDPSELAVAVKFYLKHPEKLMNKNEGNESDMPIEPNEPSNPEMFGADEMPGPLEGLEGPWRMKNGRVVYYDPREGKYYDRGMDMYLDDREADALHFGNMHEEYAKFKEELPGDYDAWRTQSGYENDPDESVVDQALGYADAAMDRYLAGEGRTYLADLQGGQLHPDDIEGMTADLISDLVGTGRNDIEDAIPGADFDAELEQLAKEKLTGLGLIAQESDMNVNLENAGFMDADDALRIKRMQDLAGIIGEVRQPNNES